MSCQPAIRLWRCSMASSVSRRTGGAMSVTKPAYYPIHLVF
jgi:hypothetical protein